MCDSVASSAGRWRVRQRVVVGCFVAFGMCLVGVGPALAGHEPAARAAAAGCSSQLNRVESGAAGPLRCSAQGVTTIIVAKRTPLGLTSMRVSVQHLRTASVLSYTSHGVTIKRVATGGAYVVLTITVANRTRVPQRFSEADQAELQTNIGVFLISSEGSQADAGTDAWGHPIGPGRSISGDLVFDVSKTALVAFPHRAFLRLVNFGTFISGQSGGQAGIVYLGR